MRTFIVTGPASRIDREHNRLCAEFLAQFGNQLRTADRGRVYADFIGARVQDLPGVLHPADAAANSQRNKNLARGTSDDVDHGVALVARRGDVQKDQFVGALLVIASGKLHRIARVAQVDEVHAFDDAAAGDVEAGNNSFSALNSRLLHKLSLTLYKVPHYLQTQGPPIFPDETAPP